MEKNIINETIFRETNQKHPIPFKAITIALHPDDIILAGHDEGYYSEDNSWDPFYYLEVHRERLENDEEFEKRKQDEAFTKKRLEKMRYANYLKLKEEFKDREA